MAVRDEASSIDGVLDALLAQDPPPGGFEIVVAIAPSEDDTGRRVRARADRGDPGEPPIRVLDNPAGTAASGLNVCLAAARGDFLIRMDGHALPARDYVAAAVGALLESEADCVGGRQRISTDTRVGRAYAIATARFLGSGGAAFRDGCSAGEVDTVYLGAWPRRTFDRWGGFDESLGRNQDDELAMRIRSGGGRLVLIPDLVVHYRPRETWSGLARQYFGYGMWKFPVLQRHLSGLRARHLAPVALVLALAASASLALGHRFRFAPIWAAVPLLYGATLVLLLAMTARKHGAMTAAHAVAATVLMHIAYGAGMLVGIARFAFSPVRPRLFESVRAG